MRTCLVGLLSLWAVQAHCQVDPTYTLPGKSYDTDSVAINDMLINLGVDQSRQEKAILAVQTAGYAKLAVDNNFTAKNTFVQASTFTGTTYHQSTATWGANFRYSTTTVAETIISGSKFGVCAASVTLSSNGGTVSVWFSGGAYATSTTQIIAVSMLINNGNTTIRAPNTTETRGLAIDGYDSAGNFQTMNLSWRQTLKPSAGTYTYCLTYYGAGSLCEADYISCEFGAAEMQ